MSPRPQKVTDDEVFTAAQRAMARLAPHELTLAAIAGEAGVTAGALVQRYGSKRELLLEMTRRWATGSGEFIEQLRAKHRTPLATLRDYARCMAHLAESPAAFTRALAYLQNDLSDPDFRKLLAKQARATRSGIESLIDEAIENGELRKVSDAKRLARTVEAVISGSMMTWAVHQTGDAANWITQDLNAVLAPYA